MPEVADMFKALELKCSQGDNHFVLTADFAELMKAVESSWLQVSNELAYTRKVG
jgi:hypothetical protein